MFHLMLTTLSRLLFLSLRLDSGSSFPRPLRAEEERACLEQAAAGDLAARNQLIEHNLRLVAHIIKKYYAAAGDQDDLISIGVIGLIKAIRTFDPSKNTRLATYAARCVENEIFMHFRTLRRVSCEVSLSEPIDTDCEGNTLELMDILSSEEDMFENLLKSDKIALLRAYLQSELDAREREIMILRYGLNERRPLTQRETAERLGISRSYVSRIEKAAIEKLRQAFETHT
ncbi:MAG: RNA polymerase sporulation sigma factor SigK [Clostridiales bacterium]|nr:RNA polymerase sporulation sigma factor SigK [Clostridiales bacterium]MDD7309089.1 RNA polymerase sporulation sigma factor SigK [Eubacteriales bacterium]MDY5346118.1 RNA polymerase sporulation sigma factor SigK [Eubacteriales bacterium]